MHYRYLGYLGYYGASLDAECNKRSIKANKLIDEYNSKINTFRTEKKNNKFSYKIRNRINKILKG